jgi:hypothetical protein
VDPDDARTAGRLHRVGALTTATVVVTAVLIALIIAGQSLQWMAIGDARRYLDGRIDDDAFLTAFGPTALMQLLAGAGQIILAVLSIILLFRMARNLRSLGRDTRWGPGWTIGGWFIPPLVLYLIPFLMLRETWRASDPDVAWGSQHQEWKMAPVPGVITLWWVMFGLVPLLVLFAPGARSGSISLVDSSLEPLAEQLVDQWQLSSIASLASVVAAGCWILIVRSLTGRHRAFTGE